MSRPSQDERGRGPRPGFADRLLAESVRALEHDGARPLEEPQAEGSAVEGGGDFEARLAARARSLSAATPLEQALRQTGQIMVLMLVVGLLLAAVAGASAARASLATEGDAPVNVFWALAGLLGIQTLLLVAWLVVMAKAPGALADFSLGGAVL